MTPGTTQSVTSQQGFQPAQVHQCCEKPNSELPPVAYQIITMTDSLFIWVGQGQDGAEHAEGQTQDQYSAGRFEQLAVAMVSGQNTIASTLLRPTLEGHSENIARRLASRFKKQVFMSMSLGAMYELVLPIIERKLRDLVQEAIDSQTQSSAGPSLNEVDSASAAGVVTGNEERDVGASISLSTVCR
ncbi:hypothetical protein BASA50_002986 [Batrachochytrium salamandrivorans]|uniref:Gelsolin-like domain-containing protein n=1 Tax=Batrachochytrium salamandrivorans TaxID=1357716 RepID=A0ABQ8FKZ4_9FUNG|nr:hypothetical protein BASA60_007098 [Batrachochytrium salamandrivorans]KAH6599472.1 hypothetical protein BASA50_002986 [Batrachochytrium salamandrivorans]KAH6602807.1 hypothetical protein BASA61_000742 [Batrachochytrium salamandrivorans]KAH9276973.1 hypothetical protein BASA83_000488 [Batrachochytrium salamandrivorans]